MIESLGCCKQCGSTRGCTCGMGSHGLPQNADNYLVKRTCSCIGITHTCAGPVLKFDPDKVKLTQEDIDRNAREVRETLEYLKKHNLKADELNGKVGEKPTYGYEERIRNASKMVVHSPRDFVPKINPPPFVEESLSEELLNMTNKERYEYLYGCWSIGSE